MVEYNRYPEYKDSGVEWIGEVPPDWEIRKLSSSANLQGGGTPSTSDLSLWDGDITWVTPKDYTSSKSEYLTTSERTISEKGLKSISGLVPIGAVLMTCRAPVGNVAIAGKPLAMNQGFIACLPTNKVINRYLYFALKAANAEMNSRAKGGTFQEISRSKMGAVKFPLPPLDVQKQIVAFLDSETKKIDDSVSAMESLISLLTEKRTALISETVTRGIPGEHTEFKDSGVAWLGEIPVGWNLTKGKKLISISKEIVGDREEEYQRLSLTLKGVLPKNKEGANGQSPDSFATYQILRKNELVFKMIDLENRNTSRVGLSNDEGLVSSAYIVAKTKNSFLEQFAYYYYMGLYLQGIYNFLGSGVRSTLNADDMKEIPVSLPDMEEQNRIVNFLDVETRKIDSIVNEIRKSIALLKEKRQTLISDAVTGNIDVSNIVN